MHMRSYVPEILMGLILCLTTVLVIPPTAEEVPPAPAAVQAPASYDGETTIRLLSEGQTAELSLHDYLIGVVMSELPASFEPEAMRAQAIASRTFALHCGKHEGADVCADSGCCQGWTDAETLRQRFGEGYEDFYGKAKNAVESSDGQVLEYEGKLIDATFFACSGGRTEDAAAVWGSSVPYLRPVESPGEEQAQNYHTQVSRSAGEFAQTILEAAPEARMTGDPAGWLGEVGLTPGRGVDTMRIGGVLFSGTELRGLFSLRSARFTLAWDGERFIFDVYGSGHRVGMSQYGAQAMALAGADAETILKTYYTGVELVTLPKNKKDCA
jgi:stage II sporulation protein D